MEMCPKCKNPTLEINHTQHDDEILKECSCPCGYYDSEIISLLDHSEEIIPKIQTGLPSNFKF